MWPRGRGKSDTGVQVLHMQMERWGGRREMGGGVNLTKGHCQPIQKCHHEAPVQLTTHDNRATFKTLDLHITN
jgi:hypothetical protein